MSQIMSRNTRKSRRSQRSRASLTTKTNPIRLLVDISNQHVSAQLLDSRSQKIIVTSTSKGQKLEPTLGAKAAWVGKDIASKAAKAKIKQVVFDRGPRRYHGRVKALAEAARQGGLEF